MEAPETLVTPRLILRRARLSDATDIFAEYTQDREVTRYLTWRPHTHVTQAEDFLERCLTGWASGQEFSWSITRRGEDRAIGGVSCRMGDFAVNLGYVLARKYWNQGYVTEAVRPVVEWASGLPHVYRVWAVCDVENPASARVMEKAGMAREGILRRWIMHPNVSREPRDCYVYSKVRPQ